MSVTTFTPATLRPAARRADWERVKVGIRPVYVGKIRKWAVCVDGAVSSTHSNYTTARRVIKAIERNYEALR